MDLRNPKRRSAAHIELDIALLNVNHPRRARRSWRGWQASSGRRPQGGLRVTLGVGPGQFGTAAEGGQALAAFEEALQREALDVIGLHVHRGGMMHGEDEVRAFVAGVLGFADELRAKLGLELKILDLGGSLGSPSVRHLGARELRLNRTMLRELEAPKPEQGAEYRTLHRPGAGRSVGEHYRSLANPCPACFWRPGRSLTSDTNYC
jgi:diaminopimelate decarboxylase